VREVVARRRAVILPGSLEEKDPGVLRAFYISVPYILIRSLPRSVP
jgi:hypothetical protein